MMIWGPRSASGLFVCFLYKTLPKILKLNEVDIHMLKVKKKSTRTRCEICSKFTIKVQQFRHQDSANFVVLVSLLLTLNLFYSLF